MQRITIIVDSTPRNAKKARKNATYHQCIMELIKAYQGYPKALKNPVFRKAARLTIDCQETHVIQTKTVMTAIAIMEFAKKSAN